MPRLPGPETVRYASPGGTPSPSPNADAFGAGIGRALQQTGQVLGQIKQSRDRQEEAFAVSDTEAKLIEAEGKFQQDQDFKTVEKRADADFRGIVESSASAFSKNKQDEFRSRFAPRLARANVNVQRRANQLDIDDQKSTLELSGQRTLDIINSASASEDDKTSALTRFRGQLASAQTDGLITPQQAQERNRALSKQIQFNTISQNAERDARGTLASIGQNDVKSEFGDAFPHADKAIQTSIGETGTSNLFVGSRQIANDTNGTKSYGILGVNSGSGSAGLFAKENPELGLTAKPGSADFDAQWREAVRRNPKAIVEAQLKYHEKHIVAPAIRGLQKAGASKFSQDPRVISFVSDSVVQLGPSIAQKHLNAGSRASSPEEFIQIAAQSQRDLIGQDFRTYLSQNPNNVQGLLNRVEKRQRNALNTRDAINTDAIAGLSISEQRAIGRVARGVISQEEQARKEHIRQAEAARKQQLDQAHNDILFKIKDGNGSQEDIDDFREEFDPPFAKFEQLNKAFEDSREADRVQSIVSGESEAAIDPFDSGDKKAINNFAERQIGDADVFSGEGQQAVEQIVERTGVVPDVALNPIRRNLKSQDPEKVAQSLESIQRLSSLDRASLIRASGGRELLKAGDALDGLLKRGVSREVASEKIARSFGPDDGSRDALLDDKKVKEFIKNNSTASKVGDIFDEGIFHNEPQLGATPQKEAAILSDYKEILEEAIVDAGGDKDIALSIAGKQIKRLYGETRLSLSGDGVIMRNPPENHYPAVGGSHEYIRDQMLEAIDEIGVIAKDSSVYLESDRQTEEDIRRGALPRYQLYYRDSNDFIQKLPQAFVANVEAGQKNNNTELRTQFDKRRQREIRRNQFLRGEVSSINQPEGEE